jgi:hypothetical protein
MSRNVPGWILAYLAAGAIGARLLVKHGAADGAALQGAAGTDALIGVSTDIPASTGETVDVVRSGVTPVVYGGNVTRGDPLTSDASGRAIAAVPGVGATLRIIGFAEVSGVLGDIGSVLIAPAIIRGPAS